MEHKLEEISLQTAQHLRELEQELETKKKEEEIDPQELQILIEKIEKKKEDVKEQFVKEITKATEEIINDVVKEEIKKFEEKKKKTTEDDVRDRLRGFARTIPAFLMAYGDENTTLRNLEENINDETFEELTGITKEEFRKLRDGHEYVTDNGETKKIPGLFNEMVFNASIKEFMATKERLANYFDESLKEVIFDYIPSQKTNQIFTPRRVVKMMIDALEKENPTIFSDKHVKFADLYAKSGLYITEIVKKLNKGLKNEIPDHKERIKWILENQVYICTPSDIIYNIVRNFVFGNLDYVSTKNLKMADTMLLSKEQKLVKQINNIFGDGNVKFDVIIGNPPFQEEAKGTSTSDDPIYHLFLEQSYQIAKKVSFITPARFLFNAGKTPKKWNEKMLNDKHLKVVFYEENSEKVFPNTDIKGGVVVTYRDVDKKLGPIGVFVSHPELKVVLKKVVRDESQFKSIVPIIYTQNKFNLENLYSDYPESKNKIGNNGKDKRLDKPVFSRIEAFTEEKIYNQSYKILGRYKNKRVWRYIHKKYIEPHENLNKWKVILPVSNGTGRFGETLSTPIVGGPNVGYTRSFIGIGAFDTEYEAQALLKYIKSKFVRTMLGMLKVTQDNTTDKWAKVPMQDFTPNSDIDWSKSIFQIDQQLYKKYNLSEKEIEFIESKVKKME